METRIVEGRKRKPRKWPQKARIARKPRACTKKVSWPKISKNALRKADSAFSKHIIKRDKTCRYPGCTMSDPAKLTCSHYYGRAIKNTRFDVNNCIALCRLHHYWDKQLGWEFQKQTLNKHGWDGRYTLFMRDWLGQALFYGLQMRAEAKFDRQAYQEKIDDLTHAI